MAQAINEEALYEQLINERRSIRNNQKMLVIPRRIEPGKIQFLLIYEASEEMHDHKIKTKIVEFLHRNGAEKIEAYMNSSIYFLIDGSSSYTPMKELNSKFKTYMESIEKECDGSIFWLFNALRNFPDAKGNLWVSMRGKGNLDFYTAFKEWVNAIIRRLAGRR